MGCIPCHVRVHALTKTGKTTGNDRMNATMSIEENTYKNKTMHHLSQMGWTSFFQAQLEPVASDGVMPARVVGVSKNSFRTSDGNRERLATLAGKLKHNADDLYPVTGDWVLMTDAVISRVLLRAMAVVTRSSSTGSSSCRPSAVDRTAALVRPAAASTGAPRGRRSSPAAGRPPGPRSPSARAS